MQPYMYLNWDLHVDQLKVNLRTGFEVWKQKNLWSSTHYYWIAEYTANIYYQFMIRLQSFIMSQFPSTVIGSALTLTESADLGFIPLFWHPQGPQGCLEKQNHPLILNLVLWCAKIGPKSHSFWKTSEMTRKTTKNDGFLAVFFLKFLSFGSNFGAPNCQIWTQWSILLL